MKVCLFGCGISLMSDQLIDELYPDCLKVMFLQAVLCHSDGDGIYEMRCLFVGVQANALFIVLPHWGNMS